MLSYSIYHFVEFYYFNSISSQNEADKGLCFHHSPALQSKRNLTLRRYQKILWHTWTKYNHIRWLFLFLVTHLNAYSKGLENHFSFESWRNLLWKDDLWISKHDEKKTSPRQKWINRIPSGKKIGNEIPHFGINPMTKFLL
jgi:hypothetical protein